MKITNKILIAVTIVLLMNVRSIYAAKQILLISPNPIPQSIQKIGHTHHEEGLTVPQLEVNDFQYNNHLTNKKNWVSFILSSPDFVSYYIYLINNENTILHEEYGFINKNPKKIDLNLENIIAGNYDLVVEVYNNEKVSTKKTFPLILE